MSNPQFKIHGKERRQFKKDLASLRSFIKTFWFYHQMDKDMAEIFGGTNDYPMSDDKTQIMYDDGLNKIKEMEAELIKPYSQ